MNNNEEKSAPGLTPTLITSLSFIMVYEYLPILFLIANKK